MNTTDFRLEAALAAVDEFCGDCTDDSKALVRAKVRGLLAGYHHRWLDAGYEALTVEQVYTSDLYNPTTQAKSRTFQVAGKLDVYASRQGRKFIIDHKTTSQDISDPDAPYWRQLAIEGQATHYMLLQWLQGEKPDGAVWDVIRKPSIAPKRLSKAERASVVADRKYFGLDLSIETLTSLQTDERETLEMYEARLAHDCSTERPEWYFARRAVPRLDNEILEYAEDLWQHSQDMLAARRQTRLPKNSGACLLYNSPCKYLGICSGHDTPDSDRWKQREDRHPELGEVGDLDALTNSRVRCFQTCRVKHHYQYELRLERHDEEEREALWFGSALHAGLETWWQFLLVPNHEEISDGTSDLGQSANGVDTPGAAKTELAG